MGKIHVYRKIIVNVRLKLRISQNRKLADKIVPNDSYG